ncbi:MAG: hypothetical protein PUE04_05340 [Lachnospira sp.]|nr:hypothetical protein [Lachnospira sp.]
MYRKPVIIQTEDLAEGVYTASGTGSVVWNKKSINSWTGTAQVTFTITIPADYSGQHIKVSVVFDQAPTDAWGSVSDLARSGETVNYDIYNAPVSHDITAVVNGSDVNIVSVKVGKA